MLPKAFILISLLSHAAVEIVGDAVINTNTGRVKGFTKTSTNGRKYTSFQGIKYGEGPVGDLRYKDPIPAKPWQNVFNADKLVTCAHFYPFLNTIVGQEDCLTLNIYTPKDHITGEENLPVLVLIASNGFILRNNSLYQPDFIMGKDVVLVTFNYRLAVLGFLSFGDRVVTGNYGLKDQALLLKWVQDNIKSFGGNPKSVTLMGVAGGAVSTQLHYLSPLSKKYFNRAIVMSGSALNPWAFNYNPKRKLSNLLKKLNCEKNNNKESLKCLQKADLEETLLAGAKNNLIYDVVYTPVVEKDYDGAFLTEDPKSLMEEGAIQRNPYISIQTRDEGLLVTGFNYDTANSINSDYKTRFPKFYMYTEDSDKDAISNKIKKYVGTVSQLHFENITDLATKRLSSYGMKLSAKYFAKALPFDTYYAILDYKGVNSFIGALTPLYSDIGVGHADTVPYYYTSPLFKKLPAADTSVKDLFMDMLMEFIKTGKGKIGNTSWPAVSKSGEEVKCIRIASGKQITTDTTSINEDQALFTKLGINYE